MSNTPAVANSHQARPDETPAGNDVWRSLVTAVRGAFGAPRAAEVAVGRGDAPVRTIEMSKFQELRSAVQGNASPSAPAQLSLMVSSLRDRLEASGLFTDVEVDQTGHRDRLIIALCHFGPELTEEDVADGIADLWDTKVRYQFWAAHATDIQDDYVEFQAATRPDSTGRYITVHLVAQRGGMPEQRQPH